MFRHLLVALCLCIPALALAQEENTDPLEGFNRAVFTFNDKLDSWVLKPAAKGYRFVTPDPVERGVGNVFSNLGEVGNIANDVLQWKWKQAGNDTGRLLINSTIGLAGIFDVAKHVGLEKSEGEDFGQTLAVWGVDSGVYVMLPFFGPTTLRDGLGGLPVDTALDPVGYIDHVPTRNSTMVMRFIDDRAQLLETESLISGDRYIFIREAYLQRREYLIQDGEVNEDGFGDDFGEFEDEEF